MRLNLTALELSQVLPVPLLLIIEGKASPAFPGSTRGRPSPWVGVIPTKPDPLFSRFCQVRISGTQWNSVAVPVLQEDRWALWRGSLAADDIGHDLTVLLDVYGPSAQVVFSTGTAAGTSAIPLESTGNLLSCDDLRDRDLPQSRTQNYLDSLAARVLAVAEAAGY